jgi:hypothetical protein
MTNQETRKKILEQYAAGKISMDEADEMLLKVEAESFADPEEVIPPIEDQEKKTDIPEEFQHLRFFWLIPLLIGMLFTLWGGFGIYNQFTEKGLSFGFWMAWIPLFLGAAIVTLSVSSSKGHWIHVRVNTGQDEWPRKIAISLPLPTGLLKLGMKARGKLNIDGIGGTQFQFTDFGALIEALEESDQPLIVHVDEGNEKVKVMIW